jgi:hypothetical protein
MRLTQEIHMLINVRAKHLLSTPMIQFGLKKTALIDRLES